MTTSQRRTERLARRAAALPLPAIALFATAGGTLGAAGAAGNTIAVQATEFAFAPDTVRVAVDKSVRLVLTNGGLLEHDLQIEKLPATGVPESRSQGQHGHGGQVAAHALPGGQAWVEFTPTAKGSYELICTITGHKEAGMRGTLVVE